ncbi:MAG: hypothetical protein ACRDKA_12825 [Actinomycetota bacterium]
MADTHTHGDAPAHEHEGATPGHTHEGYATADATAAQTHAHPDTGSHTHDDDAPGHTHDTTAAVDVRPTAGGLMTRIALSVLGAAGMIIGGFLAWFRFGEQEAPPGVGLTGIDVSNSVFYSTDEPFGASFISSAGLVVIVLGVLALLGMAFRTGWLTSLAGVLGIVAFALVLITLYRVPDAGFDLSNVGIGLWIVLAGGVIALFGGFFGTRPRAIASTTARF